MLYTIFKNTPNLETAVVLGVKSYMVLVHLDNSVKKSLVLAVLIPVT
jgi:hypothetical protein